MERRGFNARTQRAIIYFDFITLPIMFVGWVMARQLFPIPSPSASAESVAHLLSQHPLQLQIGCLLMVPGLSSVIMFTALVSLWIYRMESKSYPLMTMASLIVMGMGAMIDVLVPVLWSLAAFRADSTSPFVTQMLNDFGWYNMIYTALFYTLWLAIVGIAMLQDINTPALFPRWMVWLTFIVAAIEALGGGMAFTKSGPFAWDGLFAFWFVVVGIVTWIFAMEWQMLKLISNEERRFDEIDNAHEPALL